MKHLKSPHYWYIPALTLIDICFFGSTDPAKVTSLFLIIGFLLLVATLFAVLRLVARALRVYGVPKTQANRFAGMLTGVGGLCLALSSVGELSVRDVVVLLPIALLLYIYLFYAKPSQV